MNDEATQSPPIRVCYYMQTHTRPAQILRLARTIKEGSPNGIVVIDHDASVAPLDDAMFQSMPDVYVLNGPGGYGGFSHVERLFRSIDWLDAHGVSFDWLQNLTGQDYPLRPIADIEKVMADSAFDGYLQYAPVFPDRTPPTADWGAGPQYRLCGPFDTSLRFEFAHRQVFGRPSATKQRWLRPFMIVNYVQPWFRLSLAFSTVAIRRKSTIFNDDFICYGGSYFCALSEPCVRYARDFARENPEVVNFFHTLPAPDESFLHTVLVNSGKFRFVPDGKHYIDFTNSHYNHPKVLGVADLDAMLASGAHWARKFNTDFDSEVLDILDRHVRSSPATSDEGNPVHQSSPAC
jgi:hypothetical protein